MLFMWGYVSLYGHGGLFGGVAYLLFMSHEGQMGGWKGYIMATPIKETPIKPATVAQLAEQLICNQRVGGSIPFGGSINRGRR